MAGSVKNDGKDAEALVVEVLDKFSSMSKLFAYHRFPDTKSASRGGRIHMVAAQPSDYLVSMRHSNPDDNRRYTFFVEVKDTAEERRLPVGKVRQYGMLKKFWWAGTDPFVLVRRSKVDRWCILTSDHLFPGQNPREFSDHEPIKSFDLTDLFLYPTAESAIKDICFRAFL